MIKKSLISTLLLCSILTIGLSSCKQLWKIDSPLTDVSIQLDSLDILLNVASPKESIKTSVSLINAKTNLPITSQNIDFTNKEIHVQFRNIPIGSEIYATIEAIGSDSEEMSITPVEGGDAQQIRIAKDPTIFRARSSKHTITSGNNQLQTSPTAVFYNPQANLSGNGLQPENAVKTIEEAIAILGGKSNFISGATIYVMESIKESITLDYPGLTLKQYNHAKPIFLVENDQDISIQLSNITLDGNRDNFSTIDKDYGKPIISMKEGNLYLKDGTVITNSPIAGITIENAQLELSGNPIVKANGITSTTQKNIFFPINNPVIIAGQLTGKKGSIGLHPHANGESLNLPTTLASGKMGTSADDSYTIIESDKNALSTDLTIGTLKFNTDTNNITLVNVTEVFIGGDKANDNNDGLTAETPVLSFNRATAILAQDSEIIKTIQVIGEIQIESDEDWIGTTNAEGNNTLSILRYDGGDTPSNAYMHNLIEVNTGKLSLKNITIDGQGGVMRDTEGQPIGNIVSEGSLIEVESDAHLILNEGAVLQNSKSNSLTGGHGVYLLGELTMNAGTIQYNESLYSTATGGGIDIRENGICNLFGGTIQNNRASKKGGGINLIENACLNIKGNPIVKDNSLAPVAEGDNSMPNNIAYINSLTSSPVTIVGKLNMAYGQSADIYFNPKDTTLGAIIAKNKDYAIATEDISTISLNTDLGNNFLGVNENGDLAITDVILISNAEQLKDFRDSVNGGNPNLNAKLIADINLGGEDWTRIGTDTNSYSGIFDGQGHTISGFSINQSANDYQGLFGIISGGTVKNLIVDSATVSANMYTGVLAGLINKDATIVNVAAQNSTVTAENNCTNKDTEGYIGGLVGSVGDNGSKGKIIASYVLNVDISVVNNAQDTVDRQGGLVGGFQSSGYATACYYIGEPFFGSIKSGVTYISLSVFIDGPADGSTYLKVMNDEALNIDPNIGYQWITGVDNTTPPSLEKLQ